MTTPETPSPTFEAALRRLEEIVQRLEKGDLPLEESLALYEEGVGLSRLCHGKLEEAEGRIELLVKDARGDVATDKSGRPRTQPFARPDDPPSSAMGGRGPGHPEGGTHGDNR
jgi:exodeoxyribonuclease VII small subunit